jgi:hypothetical protein
MKLRLMLVMLLASLPLTVFVMLAFSGVSSIGLFGLFIGLSLGVPFWLLLVFPVYLLSDFGRRWSIGFTVSMSFLVIASLYIYSVWIPSSYSLEMGGKILVEKGVPTDLYYKDLWIHVLASGVAIALGVPIFVRLCRLLIGKTGQSPTDS